MSAGGSNISGNDSPCLGGDGVNTVSVPFGLSGDNVRDATQRSVFRDSMLDTTGAGERSGNFDTDAVTSQVSVTVPAVEDRGVVTRVGRRVVPNPRYKDFTT